MKEKKFKFRKKSMICQTLYFDRSEKMPVIRASICNGEQVAGFRDLKTGKFEEIMLIRNQSDMDFFVGKYGIDPSEIKKEY